MIRSIQEQKVNLVLGTLFLSSCALMAVWMILSFSEKADADFNELNIHARYAGEW